MTDQPPSTATAIVEAELRSSSASLQVLQMHLPQTCVSVLRDERSFRFDLSLTPRLRSGLCFSDHWSSSRFEAPGKLFVLPPAEKVDVRSGAGSQKAIIFNLHQDAVRRCLDDDLEWTDALLVASLDITDNTMIALLLGLGKEARNPGLASDVMCDAIAMQLAVALYRNLDGVPNLPRQGGLAPWRLSLIEERLREGPTVTLDELAALCGLSLRQLARGFRESRGMSLGAHVASRRIERAKDLLAGGSSLKAVSYQMGYSSPSSFSHAFRKSTGWTPRAFQQQLAVRIRSH